MLSLSRGDIHVGFPSARYALKCSKFRSRTNLLATNQMSVFAAARASDWRAVDRRNECGDLIERAHFILPSKGNDRTRFDPILFYTDHLSRAAIRRRMRRHPKRYNWRVLWRTKPRQALLFALTFNKHGCQRFVTQDFRVTLAFLGQFKDRIGKEFLYGQRRVERLAGSLVGVFHDRENVRAKMGTAAVEMVRNCGHEKAPVEAGARYRVSQSPMPDKGPCQ